MRLLNTHTIQLVEFPPDRILRYAILSHTWGDDEVLFTDMQHHTEQTKSSWPKIQGACAQARSDGLNYIWIDTCCIDKSSSAELTEAINSMFRWYEEAVVCYAYLADVTARQRYWSAEVNEGEFEQSRWFTRGWTLQELLAPSEVVFFSQDWVHFGVRSDLAHRLVDITRIDEAVLSRELPLFERSIAQRMSWAARRQTTRPEDMAYCLMGIFSVNMPMLYGEGGERAFLRLQEEIMKQSDDQTIFAWTDESAPDDLLHGLLASSPAHFADSQNIIAYQQWKPTPPYAMTNRGLRINLSLDFDTMNSELGCLAILHCGFSEHTNDDDEYRFLAICLERLSRFDNRYARREIAALGTLSDVSPAETIYVPQTNIKADIRRPLPHVIFNLRQFWSPPTFNLRRILTPTLDRDVKQFRPSPQDWESQENWRVFSSLKPIRGCRQVLAFLIFQEPKRPVVVITLGSLPELGLSFNVVRLSHNVLDMDFDLVRCEVDSHSGLLSDIVPMGQAVQLDDLTVSVAAIDCTGSVPSHYSLSVYIDEQKR
ncbi:hypothetical protein ABOM_002928 [Aspergillus bombycis]|uniref:Uncharacterized protein n=1 Tax=Aspergillus bombycis TaxID=109264 RepID=A0A1F8A8V1_9EURO|nr:hypothetical protein ABOM_002928 [Aspergillus bombycis]OGM48146.1 hypothetical protein ABOM_002928 [Aspergillus bombycis]